MPITDDPNSPCLHERDETGMQRCYLVLSEDERAKGFVRAVRQSYVHARDLGGCGAVTTMGLAIAETYARDPHFYGGTFCASCGDHFKVGPFGEFRWYDRDGDTGELVGT
jgi:hypothetical protein